MKKSKVLSSFLFAATVFAFALPVSAQSVVIRDGFEVNYDGWTQNGDHVSLTAVRGEGYNASRAMMVTGRKTPADGAVSMKGFYLEDGVAYNYSVYVKHAGNSAETFNLTLEWLLPDGNYGSQVIATAAAQPNQWTQLAASYATPRGSSKPTFFITTNSTIDFFFDEFTATGRSAGLSRAMAAASTSADVGLKDIYANHFRVGNILNWSTIRDDNIKALILREYNSVTAENEHKPDQTMTRTNSTNTNIRAQVNTNAAAIMNFCAQNNIPMRGHVLAWHGQTPDWFFVQDINDTRAVNQNNANAWRNQPVADVPWATPAVMNQRLESYIQNLFALYEAQYPTLHFYAYDVVNEAVRVYNQSGVEVVGVRARGFDHAGAGGQQGSVAGASPWQAVYGADNTDWIRNAFRYARNHAPAHTKLFYNDYNEWHVPRRDWIIDNILKPLHSEGILDGMGMQGHVSADPGQWAWSRWSLFRDAMDAYAAVGAGFEVQITEMEVVAGSDANPVEWLNLQPERYRQTFEHAITVNARGGGQFTAICIWGINDANTWISGNKEPTLHNRQNQRKPAYDAVAAVVPESQWGNGNNPEFSFNSILGGKGGDVVEPDANGYFFHHTFENSTTQGWEGRFGGATVTNTNAQKANGERSLFVSERGESYHGPVYNLNTAAFVPGKNYSFSVLAMHTNGSESGETFKFTLQYNLPGETVYSEIANAVAVRNQWVMLENANFPIPAGATGLVLYVETVGDDATMDFYIDDAMGGIVGAVAPGRDGTTSVSGNKNMQRNAVPLINIRGRTLSINAPTDSEMRIRVVNLSGKTVASFNTQGRSNVSLRRIPAGMYIIEARRVNDGVRTVSNVVLR